MYYGCMRTDQVVQAIEAAGGTTALARALGTTKQNVNGWKKEVPLNWSVKVEKLTGVPVESLTPSVRWFRARFRGWPNGKPFVDVS